MKPSTTNPTESSSTSPLPRWKLMWGATLESLGLYRWCLGMLLTLELVLRFRYLQPFYSDQGTLPLELLMPRVDDLYSLVCVHCHFGLLWQQQMLLAFQVVLAVCFTTGMATHTTALLSWFLYLSLTLRNTWMNYILDRYFHYLMFVAMFLPLGERYSLWSNNNNNNKQTTTNKSPTLVVYPATIALKILVVWIYLDAGYGKWMDPKQGWTYNADPLPALDTYARHTLSAQYLYALVGPQGLRLLTPIVVYVELLAAPVALLGSWLRSRLLIYTAVVLICALHFGIALTLRNAALLSFAACTPWCLFLPLGLPSASFSSSSSTTTTTPASAIVKTQYPSRTIGWLSTLCLTWLGGGTIWLALLPSACDEISVKHIWSTILHNRWNVFVGAEEYVSWEIAPGLLADGSVVDIWSKSNVVDWSMPGTGAPCTSTARPGRWRSFPYLAELKGQDAQVLWRYLCDEWDRENDADHFPGRRLVQYNFFMLQADVLPDMMFSATRKRHIISFDCIPPTEENEEVDENDETNDGGRDSLHVEL